MILILFRFYHIELLYILAYLDLVIVLCKHLKRDNLHCLCMCLITYFYADMNYPLVRHFVHLAMIFLAMLCEIFNENLFIVFYIIFNNIMLKKKTFWIQSVVHHNGYHENYNMYQLFLILMLVFYHELIHLVMLKLRDLLAENFKQLINKFVKV